MAYNAFQCTITLYNAKSPVLKDTCTSNYLVQRVERLQHTVLIQHTIETL